MKTKYLFCEVIRPFARATQMAIVGVFVACFIFMWILDVRSQVVNRTRNETNTKNSLVDEEENALKRTVENYCLASKEGRFADLMALVARNPNRDLFDEIDLEQPVPKTTSESEYDFKTVSERIPKTVNNTKQTLIDIRVKGIKESQANVCGVLRSEDGISSVMVADFHLFKDVDQKWKIFVIELMIPSVKDCKSLV